jgi:hypothetical protein
MISVVGMRFLPGAVGGGGGARCAGSGRAGGGGERTWGDSRFARKLLVVRAVAVLGYSRREHKHRGCVGSSCPCRLFSGKEMRHAAPLLLGPSPSPSARLRLGACSRHRNPSGQARLRRCSCGGRGAAARRLGADPRLRCRRTPCSRLPAAAAGSRAAADRRCVRARSPACAHTVRAGAVRVLGWRRAGAAAGV